MTNITNLQRDMLWLPETTSITEQGAFALTDAFDIATDATAYTNHMRAELVDASVGGSTFKAFGGVLTMMNEDTVPFRFKGSSTADECIWGVGFADSVAAEIVVSDYRICAVGKSIDEVVAVRPRSTTPDTYLVMFGVFSVPQTNFVGVLTGQRLIAKPDQYASQVS